MKVTIIAALVMGTITAGSVHAADLTADWWQAVDAGVTRFGVDDIRNTVKAELANPHTPGELADLNGWLNAHPENVAMPLDSIATAEPSTPATTSQINPDEVIARAKWDAYLKDHQTKAGLDTVLDAATHGVGFENNGDADAKGASAALKDNAKIVRHLRRGMVAATTPATSTVKGSAFVPVNDKTLTRDYTPNPDKKAQTGYAHPATVSEIHNDSSAKRAHLAAKPVTATDPVETAYTNTATLIVEPHQTATAKPVTATATSSATTSQAGDSVQAVRDDATAAVNELIDAHNENVSAIEYNASGIEANSQRLDRVEAHDQEQDKTIDHNNKRAMAGIAGAMAITGLHYTNTANSIALGAGNYQGANAMAVGYSHQWGGRARFSVQNSIDSQHNVGTAASVAVGW